MKNSIVFLAILFIAFTALAQRKDQPQKGSLYKYARPPGTIQLFDSLFIDETEIHNIGYLEYLHHIKKDSTAEFYLSQLPDSTSWQIGLEPKELYGRHYFRYPGFRFHPVIGVSYEQAVNFCAWRSAMVTNSYKSGITGKNGQKLNGYEVIVEYRLPTKKEWEYAASGGLNLQEHPYGIVRPVLSKSNTFRIRKKPVAQCLQNENIPFRKRDIIHKVEFNIVEDYYYKLNESAIICKDKDYNGPEYMYSGPPNRFGLYNMIGNVAEMTNIKGIAKGGSFRSRLSETFVNAEQLYVKPTEWLGFRCIAIVHLKKK